MATPTLHYFDAYGRAEVIRLLLVHSKTPFTDHRLTFEEWGQVKATHFSEFNQLPRMDIDGLELTQSLAIFRYLGVKLGYVPADPALQYQIDSLIYLKEDFINGMVPLFRAKDMEGLDKWFGENAPKFLGFLETRLSHNHDGSGWFVGDAVTTADILVFEWIWDMFKRTAMAKNAHFVEAFPKLTAFFDRMLASSPEVRAYYETRPEKAF